MILIVILVVALVSFFLIVETQSFPLLPLLPAAAFVFGFIRRNAAALLLVATSWLAYAGYEYWVHHYSGWCEEDCYIRFDFLIVIPVLVIASAYGAVSYLMKDPRGRKVN